MQHPSHLALRLSLVLFLISPGSRLIAQAPADPASWDARHPKQIFAHYMGCFPLGNAGTSPTGMRKTEEALRPDGPSYLNGEGGGWRGKPLMPADYKPTLEEGVDIDMRRAMRMGLDGFDIDVLAGQKTALLTLDAMFKVAEAKHYPFQITFCLDNPAENGMAVKYLLDRHGNSPNLARRDGKPLLLAYRSCAMQHYLRPDLKGDDRVSPENIEIYNQAARDIEAAAGQPLYLMFCLNGFVPGEDTPDTGLSADPAFWQMAAGVLGKQFGGLSAFFWGGTNYDLAAQAAHAHGLDWGEPMWFQYQNLYWETLRDGDGLDLLRDRWAHAIANKATLLQCATWNDYNEMTGFTPTSQTAYAISDLTSLFIKQWKTGKMPVPDHDRIYTFYPPYPKGSPVYPFHETAPEMSQQMEVVTFLTAPGTVITPGRGSDTRTGHDMQWQAPAGLFFKKLPPTPGPVIVKIGRGGKDVLTFTAREPITDHPFRPDHTLVGACTEDEKYWAEDFPNSGTFPPGYYADDDKDGLPNWFEMYWSGKLGDFSADTGMKPGDDLAGDGGTNLQKYLDRKNPLVADKPPAVGDAWNLLNNPLGNSFNPETDPQNHPAWRYYSGDGAGNWTAYPWQQYGETKPKVGVNIIHRQATMNMLNPPPPPDLTTITYRWDPAPAGSGGDGLTRQVVMDPLPSHPVKVEWTSPADATYHVALAAAVPDSSAAQVQLLGASPNPAWTADLGPDHSSATAAVDVSLKKGETLSLVATVSGKTGEVKVDRFDISLGALR